MPSAIEEAIAGRAVGRDDFIARDQPLVMRGLVRDWPVVQGAARNDDAFAAALMQWDNGTDVDTLLMPPSEQGHIGYNATFDGFNYDHYRVSVGDALRRLLRCRSMDDPPGIAVQSALIASCLPGFLSDHAIAFLEPTIEPRLWLGNRVTTPAHFDEYHNIACVIHGRRRFTLFAPEQVRNLYIGPLDFAPTGAAIGLARLDQPDDPRYPKLKEALACAFVAELHPGDAIYIPPMWWHHVASLDPINALVNYWWKFVREDGYASSTGLGSLLHAMLCFRALPQAEKQAWKGLFQHYVFDEATPAAHIPAERRGVLGTMTPEQLAALRERIKRYL